MQYKENILIGTMVSRGQGSPAYIREILPYGFEAFSLSFWQELHGTDLERLAREVKEVLAGRGS